MGTIHTLLRCSAGPIRNRWKPHYSGIKQDKGRLKSRRGGGGTGTAFNKLIAPLFSYLLTASIHGAINGSAWPINFALLFAYTAQRRFKCSAAVARERAFASTQRANLSAAAGKLSH